MNPYSIRRGCILLAAAAALTLAGCSKPASASHTQTTPPTVQETTQATVPKEEVEHLTQVMVAGEIYMLESYPNLKSVDLSGSDCYETILHYMEKYPAVDVTYTVPLGSTIISNKQTQATLEPGTFTLEQLLENLQYLPQLESLSLPGIHLTSQEVAQLLERYPELSLEYSVTLLGNSYDQQVQQLDLSNMSSQQVPEACRNLGLLTHLTDVTLGSQLSMADVAQLQDAAPRITFHYQFTLFGKTLSTTDETVEYKNQSIGNDGEAQLRQALAILDTCSRFVLDNCGFDYEVLAAVREDFREGPNLVWRVYFGVGGRYNALTDQETIRAVYNVTDDTCGPLKYCEGAKYIDMGHNEYLTDLSFVSGMPNLEAFIGSGSAVKELTGFENCKNLYWLELASCYKLTNIDALAGCEKLGYLNISYAKVTSLMALDSLPLERFVYLQPRASTQEQNAFVALHSGCRTAFYGYSNPWTPWRYDDNGKTFNAYYKNVIREVFNLDYLEQFLPKE